MAQREATAETAPLHGNEDTINTKVLALSDHLARRSDPEVAEEIYMESEKTAAVLRAELDAVKEKLADLAQLHTTDARALAAEIHTNHVHANKERLKLTEKVNDHSEALAEAIGRDGKGGILGIVREKLTMVKATVEDLKVKYWRLVVGLAATGGGGFAAGKYLF